MAEASKDPKRKRESRLNIPLTEGEKREVRIRAAREDKPMTKYVRELLFSDSEAVPA
jgi:plasmid stability protein